MGSKTQIIKVKNISISLTTIHDEDYICLTDIAKAKEGDSRAADIIKNWIRNRATLEFLGTWEEMYNPDFKVVEFDHFKMQAGLPSFVLSPGQWIKKTSAAGMYVRSGRYGGTYAHKDIAFEFCSAINPVFKLYLIKEFQRLKSDETRRQQLEWDVSRTLAKVNYLVHTNAVKEHLIPDDLSKSKQRFVYADEADLLNFALFNKTASSWRKEYPDEKGNIRDAASIEQLVVLSNLESFNSEFIKEGLDADARLKRLNQIAIRQMKIMLENKSLKKLEG
jgi:hypothetical protein